MMYGLGLQSDTLLSLCRFSTHLISWIAYFILVYLLLIPQWVSAQACEFPAHEIPRSDAVYEQALNRCGESTTSKAQGLIGYFYRNGYGVARDLSKARHYFSTGAMQCDPVAWCGLRGLSREQSLPACDVQCEPNGAADAAAESKDLQRSRDEAEFISGVINELLQSDPRLRRDADQLRVQLREALAPLEARFGELHQSVCDSYVRRAIAAVGLGAAADVAEKKRDLLMTRYKKKLAQGPNARAKMSLQRLENQSRSGRADRQVFFEKYADAVLSGAKCSDDVLETAYEGFRLDIRESRVTDVEQAAFTLLKEHITSVKNGSGARSEWFDDLSTLAK